MTRETRTEIIAALSTYMTMSYVFLLIPTLLKQVGVDPSAAFFGTVASAAIATFVMGAWAKLPFVVAPAPTVAVFLVTYVCKTMHLTYAEAMAAVAISGLVSMLATWLSVRQKILASIPAGLKISILYAIGGFIAMNGLSLVKIVSYKDGLLDLFHFSTDRFTSNEALVFYFGLFLTLILRSPLFRFRASALIGIIASTLAAEYMGIPTPRQKFEIDHIFSNLFHLDFTRILDSNFGAFEWRVLFAVIVFFIVDFYGAIGKFIGLFAAAGDELAGKEAQGVGDALYVDSAGTVVGAVLGVPSVAVFISSAVGIVAGGKTGKTAIFCAGLIVLSLAFIPFVGSIPNAAISASLVYIGIVLLPWRELLNHVGSKYDTVDVALAFASLAVSVATFAIDKALLVGFGGYMIREIIEKKQHVNIYRVVTALMLAASVGIQMLQ